MLQFLVFMLLSPNRNAFYQIRMLHLSSCSGGDFHLNNHQKFMTNTANLKYNASQDHIIYLFELHFDDFASLSLSPSPSSSL